MGDAIGGMNKCAFCPNTKEVVKTPLGGIDTYMCAACARRINVAFVEQSIDLVGLDSLCTRAGQTLTLRYFDFRRDVHVGGNPAIAADEIARFFRGAHATIVSGKLNLLRETQTALRQARLAKREKEEAVAATDAAQVAAKATVARSLEEVARLQAEHERLERALVDKQAQKEAAVAEKKEAEKKEAELAQQLGQLLGDASAG